MIVEIGHFALILACCVAFIQMTVPLWGAERGHPALAAMATRAMTSMNVRRIIWSAASLMPGWLRSSRSASRSVAPTDQKNCATGRIVMSTRGRSAATSHQVNRSQRSAPSVASSVT